MSADTDTDPVTGWRRLFPPSVRVFPADLAAVVVFVVLTALVALLPVVRDTMLRAALALPFVLFVPGYAFIAALFPEQGPDDESTDAETEGFVQGGIDGFERVALSFGTSIAIVPLAGLVLNFTPWGIQLVPTLTLVGGTTVVLAYIGARRRAALDPQDRFRVPYEQWIDSARAMFTPETRRDRILNVLVVVSVVLAVGSVGYAVAFPKQGPPFTEFYLLTEGEDGDLVADDYPTEFVAGESRPVIVGVGNHEHETTTYSVAAELQRVRIENNSTQVLETESLQRFSSRVPDNETWHYRHRVTPTMTGDRLRLTYMLYKGNPPTNPTADNAYREVHLWVNVTAPGAANETAANVGSPGMDIDASRPSASTAGGPQAASDHGRTHGPSVPRVGTERSATPRRPTMRRSTDDR